MGEKSPEGFVRDWLRRQGYPFELRVARALHDAGELLVRQSEYYVDPESGTSREIDVVASDIQHDETKHTFSTVTLAVECKSARDRPWVLFTAESRVGKRSFIGQRVGNYAGRSCVHQVVEDPEVQALPLFALPPRLGYGVKSSKDTDDRDVAYAAAMSAAKAAVALGAEHERNDDVRDIVFPVIAIDGLLFECYLPPRTDEPVVAQIDRGVLAWKNPVGGSPQTFIYVVTSGALDDFARGAGATAAKLTELLLKRTPRPVR